MLAILPSFSLLAADQHERILGITLSQHSLEKRADAEGGDTTQGERYVAFFYERSRYERS